MILSLNFRRIGKKLDKSKEKVVIDYKISLRSALALIERIEQRSSDFYEKSAVQFYGRRTNQICKLLAKEVLEIALNHKRKKFELLSKFESAF